MVSNQRKSILPHPMQCAASSKTPQAHFVDLVCTMPTRVNGKFTKALIDTASSHSMITLSFLQRHGQCYHKQEYTTTGISSSASPCLGSVVLDTRVSRRLVAVKYTVVESLRAAAIDMHCCKPGPLPIGRSLMQCACRQCSALVIPDGVISVYSFHVQTRDLAKTCNLTKNE